MSGKETFFIVLSGLADSRDRITIERFALNVRQYRIKDNNGHQHDGDAVVNGGPAAIETKVDARRLSRLLNKSGLPADVSNHAGTFVCNEIYYRALHRWQEDPRCAGIIFVHLPGLELFVPTAKHMLQRAKRREPSLFLRPARLSSKDRKHALGEYSRALLEVAMFLASSQTAHKYKQLSKASSPVPGVRLRALALRPSGQSRMQRRIGDGPGEKK
jgi:hypothetical protein